MFIDLVFELDHFKLIFQLQEQSMKLVTKLTFILKLFLIITEVDHLGFV